MTFELKVALGTVFLLLTLAGAVAVATALRGVDRPSAARVLIVPVEGVRADQLVDSWGAPRGRNRRHEGIDIMAPAGTPVRAAMAGTIAKLFRSKRGGLTIYQFDPSGRLVLYYAHLKAYAPGLRHGGKIVRGQVIGAVGATGNATTPHLHFEIHRASAQRQWWRGQAFNPFAALKAGRIERGAQERDAYAAARP